jgi:outer membrane protein assembly factor BamB
MHRYLMRACVAAAAGVALSTMGVTGASASGAAPRAQQAMQVPLGGRVHAASPGTQLWVKRYNGSGVGARALSVAASPAGNTVFVTGESTNQAQTANDYATVAYNATTGAQLWAKNYISPGIGSDQANAVAVSPDGKTVFVTGESTGTTSGYDYATVAYNAATGAQVWAERYNGAGNSTDDATSLGVSPTGSTVYVTGYSVGSTHNYAYATVAYNAATGAQRWIQRYDAHGGFLDVAYSIAVSSTGTVFVTGAALAGSTTGQDYTTVAYNPAGTQLWVKNYSGPDNVAGEPDEANAVTASPDGKTVFVTGKIYAGATLGYIYGTVAYNAATGAQVWAKHYHGPCCSSNGANAVTASPDSKTVYVTGSIGDGLDYATVAYNAATGAQVWAKQYHGIGPGFNEAYSVAVSPDGSTVYVTGYSPAANGLFAYATVAYDAATGAPLWVKRVSDGQAYSLAVSPTTGTVFVTGISTGEFTTIAYSG